MILISFEASFVDALEVGLLALPEVAGAVDFLAFFAVVDDLGGMVA